MTTLFVLILYYVVWLELPSFVTSGIPHPAALSVPKDKLRQLSDYPHH